METKQWRTIDKSSWPTRGEWDDEPDKMQWQDEATGLPCLIVRGPSGALCGYVGVAEGHPMFRTHYDAAPIADVHGGLTFSDFSADTDDESRHICHTPAPGEPDKVWWLGFDCAHSGDICPQYMNANFSDWETYKTISYVQYECRKLAKQIAEAGNG